MSNQYIGEIKWDDEFLPTYWDKMKASVVSSCFTEYGIRIHIIDRDQPPIIVNNALVMSLGYLGEG